MDKQTYLYVIAALEQGPVKIGYSYDPDKRVRQLQTGAPHRLSLFYKQAVAVKQAKRIEGQIHRTLGYIRSHGEWFNMSVTDAISEVKFGLMSEV